MESYIGQIQLFAFNFPPGYDGCGWMRCEGQSLPVAQYSALYSLIGNTFGGNNTVFNLPKLNDAPMVPNYMYYYIATTGSVYPSRS